MKKYERSLFVRRLRDIRTDNGKSQAEVAEALGITRGAYGRYERGDNDPSNDIVARFCCMFNVSADYLLGLSDEFRPLVDGKFFLKPVHISRDPYDDLVEPYRERLHQQYELLKLAQEKEAAKDKRKRA